MWWNNYIIHLLVLQPVNGRLFRVLQRGRFEDAYLVLVGRRYFTRVRAAVERRDPHVIVHGARDDLHPLKGARQYHNITSCRVRLEGVKWLLVVGHHTRVISELIGDCFDGPLYVVRNLYFNVT